MNGMEFFSTGVLLFVIGIVFPARAQEPHPETEAKPSQHETKLQQEWQTNQPPKLPNAGSEFQGKGLWQRHRATNWQAEHRTWQQRGGYRGYRLPQLRYSSNFGPEHPFHMQSCPVSMAGGLVHFQYAGFGFNVIDRWPEYWSDAWYDTDEVYLDYAVDGYYLFNKSHPEDRLAISVVLS